MGENRNLSSKNQPDEQDFLGGKLLIAMPNMGDPRFDRAVVYIFAHDNEHAMGVIINKCIEDLTIPDLLEQLNIERSEKIDLDPVFYGGPVQTERGLVIHTLDYRVESTLQVSPNIGVTATHEILKSIGGASMSTPPPEKYLLAVGHAGWSAGQLEQELTMNVWLHCNADEAIIFNGNKTPAWNNALKKLGVTNAMLSPEWANTRSDDQPLN